VPEFAFVINRYNILLDIFLAAFSDKKRTNSLTTLFLLKAFQ
jgi:hypothetical protein